MTNVMKSRIVQAVALTLACGVPLAAACCQFPLWIAKGAETTISGGVLIFAPLCMIPFYKQIKEWIKSPSAWMLWLIIFAIFYAINKIIDQVIVIALAGAVANIVAEPLFWFAKWLKVKPDILTIEEE